VNLGSRLEGLTKKYHQQLLFSESVFRKVKDELPCRMLDKVVVKGKTSGESIFTAKRSLTETEDKAWRYHHAGMKFYYDREFEKAIRQFDAVQELLPGDYIASLYIERSQAYLKEPPPEDWNGMEIMHEK